MNGLGLGLSVQSTKIISIALCILGLIASGLVVFSERKMISPYLMAMTIAAVFGLFVIVIVYVVVREEGWGAIFPP